MRAIHKGFSDLSKGDFACCQRSFTEADVARFANVIGFNPYGFIKEGIVPIMLVASMISKVLGMQLPGPGSSVELFQEMEFISPTFIGDTVQAKVEIKEKLQKYHHVLFKTTCIKQDGSTAIDGICRMKVLVS